MWAALFNLDAPPPPPPSPRQSKPFVYSTPQTFIPLISFKGEVHEYLTCFVWMSPIQVQSVH